MTEEVAAYLNHVWSIGDINLSSAAPGNDVLYPIMCVQLNPDVIERFARFLRESTERPPPERLERRGCATHQGGRFSAFCHIAILQGSGRTDLHNAPMGDFLKPLLNGEYQVAAHHRVETGPAIEGSHGT